jgi:hypothetical protein
MKVIFHYSPLLLHVFNVRIDGATGALPENKNGMVVFNAHLS